MKRKLITYVGSTRDLDLKDMFQLFVDAKAPNRTVTMISGLNFSNEPDLKHGVLVIWEGEATEKELILAFKEMWRLDSTGEGEGGPFEF